MALMALRWWWADWLAAGGGCWLVPEACGGVGLVRGPAPGWYWPLRKGQIEWTFQQKRGILKNHELNIQKGESSIDIVTKHLNLHPPPSAMQQNHKRSNLNPLGGYLRGKLIPVIFFYLFTAHILSLDQNCKKELGRCDFKACPTKYNPFHANQICQILT